MEKAGMNMNSIEKNQKSECTQSVKCEYSEGEWDQLRSAEL